MKLYVLGKVLLSDGRICAHVQFANRHFFRIDPRSDCKQPENYPQNVQFEIEDLFRRLFLTDGLLAFD